ALPIWAMASPIRERLRKNAKLPTIAALIPIYMVPKVTTRTLGLLKLKNSRSSFIAWSFFFFKLAFADREILLRHQVTDTRQNREPATVGFLQKVGVKHFRFWAAGHQACV